MKIIPRSGRLLATLAYQDHTFLKICKNMSWKTSNVIIMEWKKAFKAHIIAKTLENRLNEAEPLLQM